MPNSNLCIDREVVLLVWLRPEDDFTVPKSGHDPKFTLASEELDCADLIIGTREPINDATTLGVDYEGLADLVTHSDISAQFIDIHGCYALLHR